MPRRRMIDPDFWKDHCIATLPRDERLFVIGCVNNADDDGRLEGHPAYLKAAIFMYDDDLPASRLAEIKESCLEKMATWPPNHQYKILAYRNSGEDYLFFPNWSAQQKPSHPTKSKLPAPPPEMLPIFSSTSQESLTKPSGEPPSQSSLGQSSLGKVSLGQVRGVQEDFTKFLDSEKDLTDFMTTTLTEYMPRGPTHVMPIIQKFWLQATGQKMSGDIFPVVYSALQKYPIPVLAKSLVKSVKYSLGKTKPAKYILTVFDKQMKEYEKERSP